MFIILSLQSTCFDYHQYALCCRCVWPSSSANLHIAVAYPREYLRLVLLHRRKGIHRFMAARFHNGDISETTPCFSSPNLAWPCLCNLTQLNNASLYCGRPLHQNLTCRHLSGSASLLSPNETLGATSPEAVLMNNITQSIRSKTISHDLVVAVADTHSDMCAGRTTHSATHSRPCRNTSFSVTWDTPSPTGYFDSNGNWTTLLCKPPSFTQEKIVKCLTNLTVWMFGDSNSFQLMESLLSLLPGKTSCKKEIGGKKWMRLITCPRPNFNFTTFFRPHEYHLYTRTSKFWPYYRGGGVAHHLDSIPSTGRHLVIVHYYLHLSGAHVSQFHDRLLTLKAAILRTVARNAHVTFVFRGPHVSSAEWRINHSTGGDVQGIFFQLIMKQVFGDMKHVLLLLDGWEMSSALEAEVFHPNISLDMAKLVMAFVCGRGSAA